MKLYALIHGRHPREFKFSSWCDGELAPQWASDVKRLPGFLKGTEPAYRVVEIDVDTETFTIFNAGEAEKLEEAINEALRN